MDETDSDPAGLDAAIEAMIAEAESGKHVVILATGKCTCGAKVSYAQSARHIAEVRVRAAAPHLRAAALNEAADEVAAKARSGYVGGVVDGLGIAERLLRERAGRIGGAE